MSTTPKTRLTEHAQEGPFCTVTTQNGKYHVSLTNTGGRVMFMSLTGWPATKHEYPLKLGYRMYQGELAAPSVATGQDELGHERTVVKVILSGIDLPLLPR